MTDQPLIPATKSLSRRTVLRTAAWSAPVIAVAIAAPAAAASITPASAGTAIISVTPGGMSWVHDGDKYRGVQGNFNVQKAWSSDSTAVVFSMTATLVLPAHLQLSVAPGDFRVKSNSGPGWTAHSASIRSSGEYQFVYTYTSASGLGPGYANTQLYYELLSTYTGTNSVATFAPRQMAGVVSSPNVQASVSFADA